MAYNNPASKKRPHTARCRYSRLGTARSKNVVLKKHNIQYKTVRFKKVHP